jgi:hypothetical protein
MNTPAIAARRKTARAIQSRMIKYKNLSPSFDHSVAFVCDLFETVDLPVTAKAQMLAQHIVQSTSHQHRDRGVSCRIVLDHADISPYPVEVKAQQPAPLGKTARDTQIYGKALQCDGKNYGWLEVEVKATRPPSKRTRTQWETLARLIATLIHQQARLHADAERLMEIITDQYFNQYRHDTISHAIEICNTYRWVKRRLPKETLTVEELYDELKQCYSSAARIVNDPVPQIDQRSAIDFQDLVRNILSSVYSPENYVFKTDFEADRAPTTMGGYVKLLEYVLYQLFNLLVDMQTEMQAGRPEVALRHNEQGFVFSIECTLMQPQSGSRQRNKSTEVLLEECLKDVQAVFRLHRWPVEYIHAQDRARLQAQLLA